MLARGRISDEDAQKLLHSIEGIAAPVRTGRVSVIAQPGANGKKPSACGGKGLEGELEGEEDGGGFRTLL